MAKGRTKSKAETLFEERYQHISVEFPLILVDKSNNVTRFFENGIKEYLSLDKQNKNAGYYKNKFSARSKEEYLFYIRRMIFIGRYGNQEDWDKKLAEIHEFYEEMDKLELHEPHSFKMECEDDSVGEKQETKTSVDQSIETGSIIRGYEGQEDPF